jgi:non-ribosomal peptide synthetase component F
MAEYEQALSRRSKLSSTKRDLLERRLRGEKTPGSKRQPIPRRPESSIVVTSFSQERLWFLAQTEPTSTSYNVAEAIRLRGPLDATALEQSLNEIVRRHESLRTTFTTVDHHPMQVIAPSLTLPLPMIDLSDVLETEQEARVQDLANSDAQSPFDLRTGPLLRTKLLRLAPDDHVLLLTMHHIISDGWSMGILVQETTTLYDAFVQGRPATLPELPIQYPDYAHWQRSWLQGAVLERQIVYWKEQLAHSPPLLQLPTDRPRPPVQSFRGATCSTMYLAPLLNAIKAFSQQEGTTLFMTLLAAFQVLLARYTDTDDIVVGTRIAGRSRVETEGLIGFFLNALVLRTDLSGAPSFRTVMQRVREVMFGALSHQDLPFEKLVEEVRPERTMSHQPLFNIMFVLQTAPIPPLALTELTLSHMTPPSTTAKYDLDCSLAEVQGALAVSFEYSTDLFDAATIERMLAHYQMLLEAMVAQPDRPIDCLPLLLPAEQERLRTWIMPPAMPLPAPTLAALLTERLAQTPEALALRGSTSPLYYRELAQQATQLAHLLRQRGVGPGVPVGLWVTDACWSLIGLVAILFVGGAVVPLDDTLSVAEQTTILQPTNVALVIADAAHVAALPDGIACLCPEHAAAAIAEQPVAPLANTGDAMQVAAVIYTPNAHGALRAVSITQHQWLHSISWQASVTPATADDVACQVLPTTHWATLPARLGALVQGAPSLVLPEATLRNVTELLVRLRKERVTQILLTPALLRSILDTNVELQITIAFGKNTPVSDLQRRLPQLTLWQTYGDPLTPTLVQRFQAILPHARLIQHYGKAGHDTISATDTYQHPPTIWSALLGRLRPETPIIVLDRHGQPVPTGVPGELVIGIRREPVDRPDANGTPDDQLVTIAIPVDGVTAWLRTGDHVRYRADGSLEWLGHMADLARVRGYQVELRPLAALLEEHPAVRAAVVVAQQVDAAMHLVAYVLPQPDRPLTVADLQTLLKGRVPDYMLPSRVIVLDTLPLTRLDEVDIAALPVADLQASYLTGVYVAPRNATEAMLATIWADALKVPQVGIYDNFFTLGGHSLLVTQIVAQALDTLQPTSAERSAEIEGTLVSTFFEEPTVVALASRIVALTATDDDAALIMVAVGEREEGEI